MIACHKEPLIPPFNSVPDKKDFILAGEMGNSIYYDNISPDWERYAYGLTGDSIVIDINNDNTTDVSIKYATISAANSYTTQTTVSALNGALFSLSPKNLNDTIHSSSSWSSSTSLLSFTKIDFATSDTSVSGPWISKTDKYLGIKITKNGQVMYGWIRMSLLVHPVTVYIQDIIVKDFACMQPD